MSATTIALIATSAAALVAIAGLIGKTIQAADLSGELNLAQAEVTRCRETHVGELDAMTNRTRPAGPPALDAYVRPLGIHPFPINRPHRSQP